MWTLTKAAKVVRVIQKSIRKKWGYNVCIYGSVLYRGFSDSDLDIQLVPFPATDKYHEGNLIAQAVADSINGKVIKSMMLTRLGEMCYIVEFNEESNLRRIDMVIRRIVPYVPTEKEIIEESVKINERKELLRRCEIVHQ